MAERIMWDKYEAAILLEAVLKIENNSESKGNAIERVSRQLRSMAQNRGLSIDDTYRNANGISMQITAMKATAFDIDCKMKSHSKVFCEVVELYYTNKSEYNAILNQAHHWIDYSKEKQHMTSEDTYTVRSNRDAFSSWLQIKQIKKPAPNLIMMAIDEVSEYATKHNVSKVSVWNISDEEKFNALRIKMQAMRLFRLSHKNAATIFDMCWKHYMAFLNDKKNEETGTSRLQDNIHNENNNHSVAVNSERKMDIDSFYEWMTTEANMASSSCRAYASSFRTACDYALSNGLISEKLYEIADDEVLKEQTAKVMQNIDFQNYNAEQHNRFSAALKKYLEYRTGIVLPLRAPKDTPIKNATCYPYREQVVAVLREHYPYGFRLESIIDLKRFRRYAEEQNAALPESDDNLRVEIRKAGVKIDDKVYLIEQDTFVFIRKTIEALAHDGSKILFYDCIYDSDASGMEDHYISSADQLKAIMKQCRQSIFESVSEIYFAKNFVSLLGEQMEKDAVTIEIQRVWSGSQTRRTDELAEQLPAIPEEYVRRYLSGNTAFVWISEGVYFNMQLFVISEEEKEAILSFVAGECNDKGYASISDVPFGNTEEENYELSAIGLQEAIYNAVLLNQYHLNGKILTRDNITLDVVTLAKQYLIGKNECTFDEMDKKVEEIAGTRYRYMAYDALYSTMVRVDKNRYVAHQYVKFDVEAIDEILSEMIKDKFLAIKEITSFALFPVCGYPWNHYLLESYCYSYSKRYCLKVVGFNDKNAGIIVESDVTDGYNELLAQAAARAKIELNAETVGQYYFETGYMGKRKFSDLESIVERAKAIREDL